MDRTPKKCQNYKKIASNEVSTCSGCCCGILQLCDVCKGGWGGGLNGTIIHQYLRIMSTEKKNALLKTLDCTTSKEPNSHCFRATGLIMVSKEANFCDLQFNTDFVFQFSNSEKKLRRLEFQFFRQNAGFPEELKRANRKHVWFFVYNIRMERDTLLILTWLSAQCQYL